MKALRVVYLAFIAYVFIACDPGEEVISDDPGDRLAFSADTVQFDTLLSERQSFTRRLRVFNRGKRALVIDLIELLDGKDSPYMIHVNGIEGPAVENVFLQGGDSLLVLVDVTPVSMDSDLPFKVEDRLHFHSNGNIDEVVLLAYAQDVIRYRNQVLPCDAVWNPDRPYLIADTVLIDSLCTLVLTPGTTVYFDPGAIFFVKGTLEASGTAENNVRFIPSRLDEDFENIAGQWRGIYFLEGSKGNLLDYVTIRNAENGLRIGTPDADTIPDVVITHSRIENMTGSGIIGFNSDILAENLLVDNCLFFTAAGLGGGNYTFRHCTFANYSFDFFPQDPAIAFTNILQLSDDSFLINDLFLTIQNTIVWGSRSEELFFGSSEEAAFEIFLDRNILRTQLDPGDLPENIINADPRFIDPEIYNYRVDSLSPALNAARPAGTVDDLEGIPRDASPDIGAYESSF